MRLTFEFVSSEFAAAFGSDVLGLGLSVGSLEGPIQRSFKASCWGCKGKVERET